MARIRTIKPDAFLSESLCSVPRETRWTFAGLWTYADDKGRARDDVRLIKAALYPLDDSVSLADVEDDVAQLVKIGGVCRYVVDGKRLLHMPKFAEHQRINRPTASKLPPCPEHEDGERGHVVSPDASVSDHGGITEGSPWERKGREQGNGKDSPSSADADGDTSDLFEKFWDTYGKKVDRKKSEQKWRLALRKPGVTPERLIEAARRYVTHERQNNQGGRFIMDPSKWLNGERWEDQAQIVAPIVRALPHASQLELPPDGLTPEEYADWERAQRAKRGAR